VSSTQQGRGWMSMGTRSVLFGAHCFLMHGWFVAAAWWRLYGFPWDPRLWVAFFVHDLGYVGKPDMDGDEGELHPYWGACLMGALFGRRWFEFTLYHSRYLSKRHGAQPSRLCVADKLAIALTPAWLYLPMVRRTGEIREYRRDATQHHPDMPLDNTSDERWYADVQDYCRRWAFEHQDGREDLWTSERRALRTESGVWS
jgi:hypothetical protein